MNHQNFSKLLILFLVFQIFACRNSQTELKVREDILRENLKRIREVIDQYFSDNQKYPPSLRELVRHKYFTKIPIDPITRSDDWILVFEERGPNSDPNAELGITDVHSSAEGQALDGTPYSEL